MSAAAEGYFAAKARAAWGEAPPEWVAALAAACDGSTQSRVAQDLDLNAGYVSWALGRQHARYWPRVEAAVRGRLLAAHVECPVLGVLRVDRCALLRRGGAKISRAMRARLAGACPGCPHGGGFLADLREEETP